MRSMCRVIAWTTVLTCYAGVVGCRFLGGFKAKMSSSESADGFLASERRPAQELYELVWSLCAKEIQNVDPQRRYQEMSPERAQVFGHWRRHLKQTHSLTPDLGCQDLLRVASQIVLMHAPDATVPGGFVLGSKQLEEIAHEVFSTTPSGAPPPAHVHTHVATFSKRDSQPARQMIVDFFFELVRARAALYAPGNSEVVRYLEDPNKVPEDWFAQPYYYTYVQYFGAPGTKSSVEHERLAAIADPARSIDMQGDFIGDGTFASTAAMLPYLVQLGIRNLYLLPHYESEGGDGGYDVLNYEPATRLGGARGFADLLAAARRYGVRIATDAVFNHTSYRHPWFQSFQRRDRGFESFYLDVSHWEDLGEVHDGSQGKRRYRAEGMTFDRILIFPAVSRNHWFSFSDLAAKPGQASQQRRAYRHFYPFQIDLNFLEPNVLLEIWRVVGSELAQGQLAKRADAAIHWVKPLGTPGDGEKAAQAAIQLFRSFVTLVNRKAAVFPEAVNWVGKAHELFGGQLPVAESGRYSMSGTGTLGLYAFQGQATALREMLALRDTSAWWDYWQAARAFAPPAGSVWLNLMSHHDEMMVGLTRPKRRQELVSQIQRKGGVTYKSDYSAAIRLADLLAEDVQSVGGSSGSREVDPRRLALAQAVLFLLPGVPQIYYGDEIGWRNNEQHFKAAFDLQKSYFTRMSRDPGLSFAMPADDNIWDPRELLRGMIPRSAYEPFVAAAGPAPLGLQMIQAMSALRSDPALKGSFLSWQMEPLHTGGDGSVLGLVRSGASAPNVAALCNLKGQAQDVWLSEIELQRFLGVGPDAMGQLQATVLLRMQASELKTSGAPPLVGARHEGHLRVRLEPYEVVLFTK
jgi:glycosidase